MLESGSEAVLITGVFGTGKSATAAEIADVLESRGAPYAALDLDWLAWFDTADEQESAHLMMLRNLAPVIGNYLSAGVRYFILARSLRNASELGTLKDTLPFPLKVVRLTVSLEEIERRLRSDVTAGRSDDLREAAAWIEASWGEGFEDLTVPNDGAIRRTATDIVEWLGWD